MISSLEAEQCPFSRSQMFRLIKLRECVSVDGYSAGSSRTIFRVMSVVLFWLLLGTWTHPTLQARADTFDDYFAAREGTPRCYGRTYEPAHLKSHPAQQITRIVLEVQADRKDGVLPGNGGFDVGLSVWRRGLEDWYGGYGYCKAQAQAFGCSLEGDAGELHLTPLPDGGLKLQTGRLVFEGLTDFFTIENDSFTVESRNGVVRGKSDDARFLLLPLPASVCRALNP
jgi:hypothetical protein